MIINPKGKKMKIQKKCIIFSGMLMFSASQVAISSEKDHCNYQNSKSQNESELQQCLSNCKKAFGFEIFQNAGLPKINGKYENKITAMQAQIDKKMQSIETLSSQKISFQLAQKQH